MPDAPMLKVGFAGTPEFARAALEVVLAAGFQVPLVLTQPDRAAGRGMKLHASPVKRCAHEHGVAVAQPRSLRLDGKYPAEAAAAREAIMQAAATARGIEMVSLLQASHGYVEGATLHHVEDPAGEHDEDSWAGRFPEVMMAFFGPG